MDGAWTRPVSGRDGGREKGSPRGWESAEGRPGLSAGGTNPDGRREPLLEQRDCGFAIPGAGEG